MEEETVYYLLKQKLATGMLTNATPDCKREKQLYKAYNCDSKSSTMPANTNSITMQCEPLTIYLNIVI
jgi:hypothetical protein